MHELSLATEVVDMVSLEAEKNRLTTVHEILIEVGTLSGVEAEVFKWALDIAGKDSILENAEKRLMQTKGFGWCSGCNIEFEMNQILDACPLCSRYPSGIRGGREFRVVSITGE